MFENDKEQVEEQVLENIDTSDENKTSEDDSPSTPVKNLAEIQDYLNPKLFQNVKVIKESELNNNNEGSIIDDRLESLYSGTFGDISENSLINGRVVGMNDRDVLIDIGFKSEGIIDGSEFKKDNLPSIGDQVEVYLEFIEDASGNTILSKEKADFMRRWKELNDAFENETLVTGTVIRRIKGGLIVDLGVVQA